MTHEEYQQAASYWTDKEATASRMPDEELRREVDAFLSSHNTCALACGWGDFVRCTPLEYAWRDGAVWIFTEGGLKFRALEHNPAVSLAVFEPYGSPKGLMGAQVSGVAQVVDPESDDFAEAVRARGIADAMLPKVRTMLHLLRIVPTRVDYLDSSLRARGYDARQWIDPA